MHFNKRIWGPPWQSSGYYSALWLLGTQVWTLIQELRSCKHVAKKKKRSKQTTAGYCLSHGTNVKSNLKPPLTFGSSPGLFGAAPGSWFESSCARSAPCLTLSQAFFRSQGKNCLSPWNLIVSLPPGAAFNRGSPFRSVNLCVLSVMGWG